MKYLVNIIKTSSSFTRKEQIEISIDILYLFSITISFALQSQYSIILSYIISSLYLLISKKNIHLNIFYVKYWLLFFLFFMLAVINFNHGFAPLFYLIFTPSLLLTSRHIARKSIIHLFTIFNVFLYTLIILVFLGIFYHYEEADPIGSIIPWASRNGITSYLIVIQIAYAMIFYFKKKELPIFTSLLIFIIAIYGLGRGSIIASLFLLIFCLIVNLVLTKHRLYIVSFFLILSILLYFYFIDSNANIILENIDTGIQRTQFGQGVFDEGRANIINEYIGKLNIWNFIFGANYNNTSIIMYFGGNPHNSLIRLHSFYGLFGIIFLLIPFLNLLVFNSNLRDKLIFIILIFIALFRSITEPIFFPTTLDFFFAFYFFLYFKNSKLIIQKK